MRELSSNELSKVSGGSGDADKLFIAIAGGGLAAGGAGASLGGSLGTALGGPAGAVVGGAIGAAVGALLGGVTAIVSFFEND